MQLYTESQLTALSLAQVKAIAKALNTRPAVDARFKSAWILVILRKQSKVIVIAPTQPQIDAEPTDIDSLSFDEAADLGLVHAPTFGSVGCTDYTDCAELELSETIQAAMLTELSVLVNQLDPEDGEGTFEIVRDGRFVAYIDGRDNAYTLRSWMFYGNTYSSPEAAAIGWTEVHCPCETLLALATAQQLVLECSLLPDYI